MTKPTTGTSGRKATQKISKSQAAKLKGKAVATASDPPPPPANPPNADPSSFDITLESDDHRMRLEMLMRRGVSPTRYGDSRILESMGILENVDELLTVAGLSQCLAPCPTYLRFVLEFFSTLEVRADSTSCTSKVYSLTFRLQNEERTLRNHEIERIYGFKRFTVGELASRPEFQLPQFWGQITSASGIVAPIPYDSRACKLTSIRNPVIKYLQKLLSFTLCARKEASSPRNREMEILWAIVDRRPRDFQEDLMLCFEKVVKELKADRSKKTKIPDPVYCGALITPILAHFGMPLSSHTPISESYLISWDKMESMRMVVQGYKSGIAGISASYVMQNEGKFLRLPNTDLTYIRNLSNVQNLELASPEHLAESVDPLCEEIMTFGRVRKAQAAASRRKRPASSVLSQEERLAGIEDRIGGLEDKVEELRSDVKEVKESQHKILELLQSLTGCFTSSSHGPSGSL